VSSMHYPTGRNAAWPNGFKGELSQGVHCVGSVHDLSILQNVVNSGDGTGIRIFCSGPRLLVQGNAIIGNCRKYGESLQLGLTQGIQLLGNSVSDPGQGCLFSVSVDGSRDVRIQGGRIESGLQTNVGLWLLGSATFPTRNVVLRDLHIVGSASGVGVQLDAASSRTTLYDSVCVSGYPTALRDSSPGGATLAHDPAGACVPGS
jgi:hypothetical protein